ncbi:hypothetical protein [Spirosoma endophyticum]|nr:hypothetical protein [Spirosoma endophyticum]
MKTTTQHVMNVLLVSLLMAASVINAQAATLNPDDSTPKEHSFEVGMFMEAEWTVNLMLAIHQPKRIMITLRNEKGVVIYREYLKKSTTNYRRKFKFDKSEVESGVYQFEISDNQQTIVRRVEVVNIPTVESQRYITFD